MICEWDVIKGAADLTVSGHTTVLNILHLMNSKLKTWALKVQVVIYEINL